MIIDKILIKKFLEIKVQNNFFKVRIDKKNTVAYFLGKCFGKICEMSSETQKIFTKLKFGQIHQSAQIPKIAGQILFPCALHYNLLSLFKFSLVSYFKMQILTALEFFIFFLF